jgi:phage FluMu gp28-like protein
VSKRNEHLELSRYFLPYQIEAIMDEIRLRLWEKSIRIGATYCYAFRQVRRRMIPQAGNYLHTSVNEKIGKSFILDCRKFVKVFEAVYDAKCGASDVVEEQYYNSLMDRQETSFSIHFSATDQWIKVFSSNPDSLRGEGGEVGIDELTSHRDPEAMLQAAGGRAMWGYPIRIWTSHKGEDSCFNRILKEERAKGEDSRWGIFSTDLYTAIEQGLVDKINQTRGLSMTKEDFIADTIALVGGQEAFEEECLLKPRKGGDAAIKWQYIEAAKQDYDIYLHECSNPEQPEIDHMAASVAEAIGDERCHIGYDVARTGHLSAVFIIGKSGDRLRLRALLLIHKTRFPVQRDVIKAVYKAIPGTTGCGDSTGLGMETCEELELELGEARFKGVNFSSMKPTIGTKLVQKFEDGDIELPRARKYEFIHYDFHGLRTEPMPSGRIRFYESANPVEKRSHCDIAWSGGLAVLDAAEDTDCGIDFGD